ncbi:MAG TPA: tetratricopeptide repeat protein [Candidatus Acidoferrum sp.]|nr:tetratricopeptide repeat protein [Candidatus Acidoferrum sp.]
MQLCTLKHSLLVLILVLLFDFPWHTSAYAQDQVPGPILSESSRGVPNTVGLSALVETVTLGVYLKTPSGKPAEGTAVVTLIDLSGQFYRQETTKSGYVQFNSIAPTEYTIQVVAQGFESAVKKLDASGMEGRALTVELQPSLAEDAAIGAEFNSLSSKAQKELGKVKEALRVNKSAEARSHLDAANRIAPNHAEVQYLYGVYSLQTKNLSQAKSYWMKSVELNPKYLLALLSLAEALIRENRPAEAREYLNRAVEVEPSSWRAYAILADASLRMGSAEEAVKHAERALELGHGQAAIALPVLACALAKLGEKARAMTVLQAYLQEHASDPAAKKLQETLQTISMTETHTEAGTAKAGELGFSSGEATALPLPSNWLPPDVDEKVPPVEPGTACALGEVIQRAGKRVQEFVENVDRFTASEFLKHEPIDKWGFAGSPETRKYDYVVSVEEIKPGSLNVEEFRGTGNSPSEFPGGVATKGLPALVLIFHPYNAGNFEMTCEGLARWSGGLAWQVHFLQRPEKPNTMRRYRIGVDGPSYPVALKGRAWILADSFQIARLETDLVAPLPEIRLFADHTAIEYGPVKFRNRNVEMWLPQSAEVFYDWRGRRSHRRHTFSNYLLFSVDDRQRISAPKVEN